MKQIKPGAHQLKEELIKYLMGGNNFHNGEGKKPITREEALAFFNSLEQLNSIDVIDEEINHFNEENDVCVEKLDLLNNSTI